MIRLLLATGLFSLLLYSCSQNNTAQPSDKSGKELAQAYCSGCHVFPDPSLLDKKSWERGVIPKMAFRLGMEPESENPYENLDVAEIDTLIKSGVYASQPAMHPTDWQKIIAYYTTEAPSKLPSPPSVPVITDLTGKFRATSVKGRIPTSLTLFKYDSANHQFHAGFFNGKLYNLDRNFRRTDSIQLASTPSDLIEQPDGSLDVLLMGKMDPNDLQKGTWVQVTRNPQTKQYQQQTRLTRLQRPVHQLSADLNQDGRTDVLICEFGNVLGKLAWYEQKQDGAYKEHIIDYAPGARVTYLRDLNADGRPEIIALLTQGDESVVAYYNRGNGQFEKKVLLRFPPVYGSSYIDLADFNGDNHPDIAYTNGDNADYSIVLKPYHGVRIFLNNGKNQFEQSWFFPMHGASKVLVDDFDKDGDPDMAAISFFPDAKEQPGRGFLFFENTGKKGFVARTVPEAGNFRWMLMEKADYDQDGDADLLLGYFTNPRFRAGLANQPSVLILQNTAPTKPTLSMAVRP